MKELPILLIDDEVEILQSLKRELRSISEIHTTLNAEEALSLIKTQPYSVILSDFKLPGMNGIEFLKMAQGIQPMAQRVLLTAFIDLPKLPEAINEARINLFFTKPWKTEDLKNALEELIRINSLNRENSELRRMALTDSLTEVANRRYFWERLEAELSRALRFNRPLSLIICDIDDFKKYNDQFGHPRGDAILKEVAQCLEKKRRSMDLVARYGGEEFTIILPEVDSKLAYEIAERHLEFIKSKTGISLSFGVATFPEHAHSSTELLELADKALYEAKNSGKGKVVLQKGPPVV